MNRYGLPTAKVIYFKDGPGYILIKALYSTNFTKTMLVKSLSNGRLYVRKEEYAKPFDPDYVIQNDDVKAIKLLEHVQGIAQLEGWTDYQYAEMNSVISVSY